MGTLLHLILVYRYWILFPIACFEGPITGFVVGTLVALGYFNVFAAYFLLVMGDIVPDTAYYYLGRWGDRKALITNYLGKVGITEEHFGAVRRLWQVHIGKTMFFSKLAYGLSTPFLISAGLLGVEVRDFFRYALPVTFGQYAILMALGYYFGAAYYPIITQSFTGVGVVAAVVIAVAVAYALLTRFMRRKLLETEKEEERKE